ncbi:MAG: hypothetical protein JNL28_04960 [Planctomycetes bacterium]|nr:hypothetical protein [Planctomycetota bacterium]
MRSWLRAPAAVLFVGVLCVGCGAPGPVHIPITHTRFDALEPARLVEFRKARAHFVNHEYAAARDGFAALFAQDPENVIVGIWQQECEFALLPDAPEISARWARRALEQPTVANHVLAARVATDTTARLDHLQAAEALDPRCAWVEYGRAYTAASAGDWPLARESLARAKAADPGHLWTFWLEAWIATRTASLETAASALSGFLARAVDDPRVEPRLVDDARLDLALVWTLSDEPRKARPLIDAVDPNGPDALRRLTALALVEQALGDLKGALDAAGTAERLAPGEILPIVQQALLYEEWLGDDERAEAAWGRALALARSSTRLVSVLERTRAGVRLERFAAARARKAGP